MRTFGLAAGIVVACALSAHAEPEHDKAAASKMYAEGQALYNAGDFRGAADKFQLAYDRDPDPVYLFNVAQAHRFAKQCRAALDSYKHFLAEAPSAPNRDKVQHYIAEMDACAQQQALQEPKGLEPGPPQPVEPKPMPDSPGEPQPEPSIVTHGSLVDQPHRASHLLAYTIGGAGVVALAAGVYFSIDVMRANHEQDGCKVPNSCDGSKLQQLDDRGGRDNVGQLVSYSLAAAALGTATWLLLRHGDDEHSVAVVPTHGGAFVSAGLRF